MKSIVTEKICLGCGSPDIYVDGRCRSCKNEYNRNNYKANIENRRKTRNATNAKRIVAIREWHRNWHIKHPSKDAEYHKKYYDQHPEKLKQKNARSRAKKKNAGGTVTSKEWLTLLSSYKNQCLCCGKKEKIEMDHIVPLSAGGSNTIDNIQPLCRSCNARKNGRTIDYR